MYNLDMIMVGIILIVSISVNIILVMYFRQVVQKIYSASEEASAIFTRLETFQQHLTNVYEMPTFYGDETLKALLQHVGDLTAFLTRYEEVYSFTQPDLLEQLNAATEEQNEQDEQDRREEPNEAQT